MFLIKKWGILIKKESESLEITGLEIPRDYYTRQGGDGGIFVGDNYKPYMNTLTPLELKVLHEMYELADGIHKKVLFQLIRKYGPDKLEL